MKIQDYLKLTHKLDGYGFVNIKPRVYCNDGFNVSIQADSGKYCSPRKNLSKGNYSTVELGFPSSEDVLINSYAEDIENPTYTVYGYVPTEIVDELISKHGGIDFKKMFINITENKI